MSIIGIGTDIVEINRISSLIKQWGDKFVSRVFSQEELDYAQNSCGFSAASLAARFAAKEAVLKAFGTGLRGCRWVDIKVIIDDNTGRPEVFLAGNLKKIAYQKEMENIFVSLSHCRHYAIAYVLVEGRY